VENRIKNIGSESYIYAITKVCWEFLLTKHETGLETEFGI
jgi:hypothetical protein